MRLTLRASAKINLDLRIGARRPDGYHDLSTVLQTLDLHDTVTLESRRGPLALDGDPALMPLDQTQPGVARRRGAVAGGGQVRAIRAVSASASSSAFRRRPVWAVAAATPPPRW